MSLESQLARLSTYVADKSSGTSNNALGDCVYSFDPLGFENYVNNVNKKVEVQNLLEKVDIGYDNEKRPTYISQNLSEEVRGWLVELLKEYKDCFA